MNIATTLLLHHCRASSFVLSLLFALVFILIVWTFDLQLVAMSLLQKNCIGTRCRTLASLEREESNPNCHDTSWNVSIDDQASMASPPRLAIDEVRL